MRAIMSSPTRRVDLGLLRALARKLGDARAPARGDRERPGSGDRRSSGKRLTSAQW
jgi:hypothetical protein